MTDTILTIIDTKNNLYEISLSSIKNKRLIIGRTREPAVIVIPEPFVSQIHGEFYFDHDQLYYRNLNNHNGTFVEINGKDVLLKKENEQIKLSRFCTLRIGNRHDSNNMVVIQIRTVHEPSIWKQYVLHQGITSIGRSDQNDICLKHPGVSRRHCEVHKEGSKVWLSLFQSKNGVLLNGHRLIQNVELKDKDIFYILDFPLIYSNGNLFYLDKTEGVSLSVHHLTKEVGHGNKKKRILNDVSLEINGNDFVAIIGGSGAGKTTLMNAISGFEPEFEGRVFCNGLDLIDEFDNFKDIIGYVPQQDIIYENLTLRGMLKYTAKLKMSSDISHQEMEYRIDEVLKTVELKPFENQYIRKLSGGQKKRASIAVELLADPKLFFLDEPTSGLDPGIERNLMLTLKNLSKTKDKTIIIVTHSPLSLDLCDKVIFMNPKGELSFFGNVEEAKIFFGTNDLVDVYNLLAAHPSYWSKKYKDLYGQSYDYSKTVKPKLNRKKEVSINQYLTLTQRNFEILVRDIVRLSILLCQPILIAFLLKIVADKNIFEVYDSTKSILFALVCSCIWIGLFNSIQEVCKERAIVKREYMGNLKLKYYLFSKLTVQTVLGMIQAILLCFSFLKLVGATHEGLFLHSFYLEIIFTAWLTVVASSTLGLCISSLVRSADKAMTIAPFTLILQLLFSGILFSLKGIGEWISYCTMSRWAVEAMGSISDLNAMPLKLQTDFPMIEHEAEAFFKATKPHLLFDWMILFVMIILFMILCGVFLKRISKDRR